MIWLMSLPAAGQTLNVPIYLVPTAGAETALGPAKILACFTAHDLPGTPPPCAPVLCAQFLGATLTFFGVFTPPAAGVWVSLWTPYQPGNGQLERGRHGGVPGVRPHRRAHCSRAQAWRTRHGRRHASPRAASPSPGPRSGCSAVGPRAGSARSARCGRTAQGRFRDHDARESRHVLPRLDRGRRADERGRLRVARVGAARAVRQRDDLRVHRNDENAFARGSKRRIGVRTLGA